MVAAGAAYDVVDTRVAKAPKEFDGDMAKWKHFKVHLLSYIGAISLELKSMMKIAEELKKPT